MYNQKKIFITVMAGLVILSCSSPKKNSAGNTPKAESEKKIDYISDENDKPLNPGFKESVFSKSLTTPGIRILEEEGWNVWCVSPIMGEDGKVHVFYSRWKGTHDNWLRTCEIAHAVADKPEGPYKYVRTVLTGRGPGKWDANTIHNPTIQKVGNKYALFFIGNNLDYASKYDGHHSSTQRVGLALADNLYGEFKRVGDDPIVEISEDKKLWDSYLTTNPALLQHPDGKFWLYYKAWDKYNDKMRKVGFAVSDKIEGPYKKYEGNPVLSYAYLNKQVEDPYVFVHKKKFYMITRDMGVIHPHVGLIVNSEDGIKWSEPELGYQKSSHYFKEKTERFERPQILNINGRPAYLFLALMGGKYGTSSGAVLKIDQKIF